MKNNAAFHRCMSSVEFPETEAKIALLNDETTDSSQTNVSVCLKFTLIRLGIRATSGFKHQKSHCSANSAMREGHDCSIEVFGGAIFFQLLEIFYARLSGPALVTCTFYVAFGVQKRELGKCLMANSHHPPSSIFYLFFRSGIFDYLFSPFFLVCVFYMFTTPSKFSFHISSCEFVETTQRLSQRLCRIESQNLYEYSIEGRVETSVTPVSRDYSTSFPTYSLPFILP